MGCPPDSVGHPLCAVENSRQPVRVFAVALEGTANCSKGLRERKNVAPDQQISIFCAYWMPVDAIGCNGNFRDQIGSTHGDTFACNTAQRDPADDSVFCCDLLFIEELTKSFYF